MNRLPEEILTNIWSLYYKKHVMKELKSSKLLCLTPWCSAGRCGPQISGVFTVENGSITPKSPLKILYSDSVDDPNLLILTSGGGWFGLSCNWEFSESLGDGFQRTDWIIKCFLC